MIKEIIKALFNKKKTIIFIDSIEKADDNAEHLYKKYKNLNTHNIFFILKKDCTHWYRLKNEDFKLIPFGGVYYFFLLLTTNFYISSHLPKYKYFFINKYLKNYFKFKFIFLQHGVTHNDISNILNRHKIDLIITSTKKEYQNFIENSAYYLNQGNVLLSGLPRYDTLLDNKIKSKKIILVMPTWRANITEHVKINREIFTDTKYFKSWTSFFNSIKLKNLIEEFKYRVIFIPHPEVFIYVNNLDVPSYIDIKDLKDILIQEYLIDSSMLITDYSSIAFDMAIQKKPVCYFQFDKHEFYEKSHLYQKCYYNYKDNGFGEISITLDELIISLKKLLISDCKINKIYLERINNTFKYFDIKNSERIINKMNKL